MSADTPPDPIPDGGSAAGSGLVNASFAATGVLLVAGTAGAAAPASFEVLTAAVSAGLFAVGAASFLWGYGIGVVRSRTDKITMLGLFWLAGTAPKVIRFRMRLAFVAQIVIAAAVASVRPYTAVAFVVLGPMIGLGLLTLWGARHGTFFAKDPD